MKNEKNPAVPMPPPNTTVLVSLADLPEWLQQRNLRVREVTADLVFILEKKDEGEGKDER